MNFLSSELMEFNMSEGRERSGPGLVGWKKKIVLY
jgi:hypothetical protein